MSISLSFPSRRELIDWLKKKNFESGSPEAYDAWLQDFFDNGNVIEIGGEEWDYLACRELV